MSMKAIPLLPSNPHLSMPSPRFSLRKVLKLAAFGILCFAAGNYRIQINNTVVNPIRTFFGLPPTYLYKGPATVEVEDVGALRGPTVPSNPDPWIKEIAGLMSDFYELLFKMRYWSEDSRPIDYPPHAPQYCINTEITSKYRLERQVVHLLQLLPYIRRDVGHNWEDGAGDHEFLLYGAFADFRDDDDLEQSRDPLFASVDPLDASVGWDDEDGQYMRPYYTPLNQLGNHGVVLILDTRSRQFFPDVARLSSSTLSGSTPSRKQAYSPRPPLGYRPGRRTGGSGHST